MDEIQQLKDEIEKAKQEKSMLLESMSGEIRSQMKTILGFAELILQQKTNPPLTQEYAFDIRRSAQNIVHRMNALLNTSKSETKKPESVSEVYYIRSLLEEVNRVIGNQAKEKGLEYRVMIEPTLPYRMKGAVSSIREIILNVMDNAVKYTKEGMVSLDIHYKWRTEKQIQLEIIAEDTGIGMKEADVQEYDTKVKHTVKGTGLGNSLVKGLLEQMDGELRVESEYGKGTKIIISLTQEIIDERPVGDLNFRFSDTEEKEFNQAFITTAKVLIVDDNEMNLKVIAGLLQKYDIDADIVSSGYMAIDFIRENEYDLIFMDHMMPGMDGVETMLRIREMDKGKYGTLPIIAITANAPANGKEDMMMLGFDGYLKKPIDVDKMERVLLKFIPKSKISYVNINVVDVSVPNVKVLRNLKTDMLENMDTELGIQNCGGTPDDYYQVMDVVLKYGGKRLEKLKKLINEKDYVNYIIDVHSLKSTAANIGAMELSQMALEHEQAGKIGDFDYIEANYEKLLSLYAMVLKEIALVRGKEVSENLQDYKSEALCKVPNERSENNGTDHANRVQKEERGLADKSIKEYALDRGKEVQLQSGLTDAEIRSLIGNAIEMLDDFELDKAKDILREAVKRTKK